MIDQIKKQKAEEQKEKVRKRIKTQIDPNAYAFIPAKKQVDYYDNDIQQRVAVYARVSTDNIQQTSSYELQKKYYEEFVIHHPNWILVKIYADVDSFYGLIPKSPSTADFSVVHGLLFGLFGYRVLN